MITERDLFFSDSPKLLLSKYTLQEIENMFGPLDDITAPEVYSLSDYDNYLNRFMQNLWRKYGRLELISGRIYDYLTDAFLDSNQLKIENYSIMSLQKLQTMISELPGFESLNSKITQKIDSVLQKDFILVKAA